MEVEKNKKRHARKIHKSGTYTMTTQFFFNSRNNIIFEAVFFTKKNYTATKIARGERPKQDMKPDHYIHTAYSHIYTAYT